MVGTVVKKDDQNPHAVDGVRENSLEVSIGHQVREFRTKLNMTVSDLAKQAELSAGMLSKIENGMTSPSLSTLQSLSRALNVPVTAFFRKFEEQRDATFVKSGEGLTARDINTNCWAIPSATRHLPWNPISSP